MEGDEAKFTGAGGCFTPLFKVCFFTDGNSRELFYAVEIIRILTGRQSWVN